ncbi:MAG: GntR family transcriptional regulator [Pseudomonadota bacterium]
MKQALKPSSTKSRAGEIAEAIERSIRSGELQPGSRLNEPELAEQFKTSRTPVREAIQRLSSKELVTIETGRGAFVAKPGIQSVLQMFEALSEIEADCARLCALRITASELEELEGVHASYSGDKGSSDFDDYYTKSIQFHEVIVASAKNKILQDIAIDLAQKLKPYRLRTLELPRRVEKSIEEHTRVLQAIATNDEEAAERFMREHTRLVTESAMLLTRIFDTDEE